ncbi:MAG: hypothetical protein ACYC5N_06190 [Endomicrobiales bacterium]
MAKYLSAPLDARPAITGKGKLCCRHCSGGVFGAEDGLPPRPMMRLVDQMGEAGDVVVSLTVSKTNSRDLERAAAMAREPGFSMFKGNRLNHIGKAAAHFRQLCIPPSEELSLCAKTSHPAKKYPGSIGSTCTIPGDKLKNKWKKLN